MKVVKVSTSYYDYVCKIFFLKLESGQKLQGVDF